MGDNDRSKANVSERTAESSLRSLKQFVKALGLNASSTTTSSDHERSQSFNGSSSTVAEERKPQLETIRIHPKHWDRYRLVKVKEDAKSSTNSSVEENGSARLTSQDVCNVLPQGLQSTRTDGEDTSLSISMSGRRIPSTSLFQMKNEDNVFRERQQHIQPKKALLPWEIYFLLLSDVIGSGFLYLPHTFAQLGWFAGTLFIVLALPLNLYTGHLLWRCKKMFVGAVSYGDLSFYLFKGRVAYVVFAFVAFSRIMYVGNFMTQAGRSLLHIVFPSTFDDFQLLDNKNVERNVQFTLDSWRTNFEGTCYLLWIGITVIILIPLLQFRSLHGITYINILNASLMVGTFILICTYLGLEFNVNHISSVWPMESKNAYLIAKSLSTLTYAYSYQLLILEIIAEMKDVDEFPKINVYAGVTVGIYYLAQAFVCYYYLGFDTPTILTDMFGRNWTIGQITCAFVYIHLIISSVIRGIVTCRGAHLFISPRTANVSSRKATWIWLCISTVFAVLAFLFSMSSGIFNILMTLFSGVILSLTIYGLPALFFLCAMKKSGRALTHFERYSCYLLLFLALVLLVFTVASEVLVVSKHGGHIPDSYSLLFSCERLF